MKEHAQYFSGKYKQLFLIISDLQYYIIISHVRYVIIIIIIINLGSDPIRTSTVSAQPWTTLYHQYPVEA